MVDKVLALLGLAVIIGWPIFSVWFLPDKVQGKAIFTWFMMIVFFAGAIAIWNMES